MYVYVYSKYLFLIRKSNSILDMQIKINIFYIKY